MARPAYKDVASNTATSQTSITVNKPATTADGDLLVIAVHRTASTSNFTSTPGGWTASYTVTNTDKLWTYYKIASSEPSSYTFEWSGACNAAIVCLAYSGLEAELDDFSQTTATGTRTSTSSVTATQLYDMIIAFAFNATGGAWTPCHEATGTYYATADGHWAERYDASGKLFAMDLLNYGPGSGSRQDRFAYCDCAGSGVNGQVVLVFKAKASWLSTITPTAVIGWSDQWYYDDNQVDYYTTSPKFYENNFTYTGWSQAAGPFGGGTIDGLGTYDDGAGSPATALGNSTGDNRPYFFKRPFSIDDVGLVVGCRVHLIADDASAFWINGTMVDHFRINTAYEDWDYAMSETGGEIVGVDSIDEGRAMYFGLSDAQISALLQTGTNLISVVNHQQRATSSDRYQAMKVWLDTVPAAGGQPALKRGLWVPGMGRTLPGIGIRG